jgi:hypothetical protein
MKLEQIMELWSEDAKIDKTRISEEAVKTVSLHSKYHNILSKERLRLRQMEQENNELVHLKFDYYMGELDADTLKEKGWAQYQRKVLKGDVPRYIEADKDIIAFNLKYAIQKEKVDFLVDILKSVHARNFSIKSIIDWSKFAAGEF